MNSATKEVSFVKWTDQEVVKMLDYVKKTQGFELPTVQAYYTKLLEKTGIRFPWSLVRWKINNLRITYTKTKQWQLSEEAKRLLQEEGVNAVRRKIHFMCPYFNRLSEIFGQETEMFNRKINVDSATLQCLLDEDLQSFEDESANIFTENSSDVEQDNESMSNGPKVKKPRIEAVHCGVSAAQASSIGMSTTNKMINERSDLLKMKLELDKKKLLKELEISEKRLELDREIFLATERRLCDELEVKKEELKLKTLRMEMDERMQVLQLEKDERLAKFELQLKYKNTNTEN